MPTASSRPSAPGGLVSRPWSAVASATAPAWSGWIAALARSNAPAVIDGMVAGTGLSLEADDDRLRGRRLTPVGHAVERDEHVGLGEVRRARPSGHRVCHQPEPLATTLHAVAKDAHDVDDVAVGETELAEVVGVDEHDSPAGVDAAIAVVEAVDRRVVLVVAAHGLQQQVTLRDRQHLERVDGEAGLPCGGREGALVAGWM